MRRDGKFVRIKLHGDSDGLEIWGLSPRRIEFLPLWSTDWDVVVGEFGNSCNPNGITEAEVRSVVDANDVDTPDEAWAALAKYRLTVC